MLFRKAGCRHSRGRPSPARGYGRQCCWPGRSPGRSGPPHSGRGKYTGCPLHRRRRGVPGWSARRPPSARPGWLCSHRRYRVWGGGGRPGPGIAAGAGRDTVVQLAQAHRPQGRQQRTDEGQPDDPHALEFGFPAHDREVFSTIPSSLGHPPDDPLFSFLSIVT